MEYVKGLLSICCTCYNHEKYIEECIESIWKNDYKNVEIIVIDDGSTDNSVEVLKRLQAKSPCRFEIITQANTHNIGLNMNRTIAKAQGEFITFMSCDDYYTSNAFSAKMNAMLLNKNIAFCLSLAVETLKYKRNKPIYKMAYETRFNSETSIHEMCELEYNEGTFAIH